MYLELLITATAVQQNLANAYVQSDRMPEIGKYFLAVNPATIYFFEQIEPPSRCTALHKAFLTWKQFGNLALLEELREGKPVNSVTTRQFILSGQQFADALQAFALDAERIRR